ncbi:MAG: transcription-repair coupling factor [Planctomycetes bacterium]|nr:transcription-repair coupling factor [Planctomycetota bacterium]
MRGPLQRIGELPEVRRLPDLLQATGEVEIVGASGSGAALVAAWLMGEVRGNALIVCVGPEEAEEFAEDVNLFHKGLACYFPALEVLPGDVEQPNEAIVRARLNVLRHLAFGETLETGPGLDEFVYLEPGPRTRVVVSCAGALIQPTRSVEELRRDSLGLQVGAEAEPGGLVEWLVDHGYVSLPQVRAPGQYCLRGGILDVYSHGALEPVRIEFFGDEVDSIRTFEPGSQLSTNRIEGARITAGEVGPAEQSHTGALPAYFAEDSLVALVAPDRIRERMHALFEQADRPDILISPAQVDRLLGGRRRVSFHLEEADAAVSLPLRQRDTFGPDLDTMITELGRICEASEQTTIYCTGPAEAERLESLLKAHKFEQMDRLDLEVGRLNHGIICDEAAFALIPHHRLFGRYRQRRLVRHAPAGRPLASAEELNPGDLVVHVKHGIGRFLGTGVLERNGRKREYLRIEFADDVLLHVPCESIELVHRYIGVGGRRPKLSRIRSRAWSRAKRRVRQAVEDLAAGLLQMQALRETQAGIEHPGDTEWQRQFESEFPYEETEDQLLAAEALKRDMRCSRPMDRLLCGDVGYGKTELAMRAAFNCVMGGRQSAVLAPTTVLAQQHFRTFSERMADYPFNIESLSRFRTGAETRQVLGGMADGTVDIVIGTHRLLQKDVSFKNLGLVIIDEEQRFGVAHKEKLKRLRATVDVLTMTATPIPRTLHMALMGLKEISALQTPPRQRLAIQTRVGRFDPELVRQAVLRELNRDGQVFIIHNRVRTIAAFAENVRKLVPEATVAVAHGQMPERELADTMEMFTEGLIDVLVSTTIIENGLDIPNANTLIVHRAELLGLSEMHQLRGRVGRYIHKAYAYFFRPSDRPITPEAEQRLDVIRRYSQLGAGFDIALRDLEIRGAGNILGPAQSGHIATVGYNLYCRLLRQASAGLKGETLNEPPMVALDVGLQAYLPEDYVPTPRQRMDVHRRLSRCATLDEVRKEERDLRDRFGPPPDPARNLLLEAQIRLMAGRAGIDSIHIEDGRLMLGVSDPEALARKLEGARPKPRFISDDLAVLDGAFSREQPEATAHMLKALLSPAARQPD